MILENIVMPPNILDLKLAIADWINLHCMNKAKIANCKIEIKSPLRGGEAILKSLRS